MDGEFLRSDVTKYIAATVVGYLIAVLSEITAQSHANKKYRESLREALAIEVVENLGALDDVADTYSRNLKLQRIRHYRYPRARMSTVLLEKCMDPQIASLLSAGERLQAGVALAQSVYVNGRLDTAKDSLIQLAQGPLGTMQEGQNALDYAQNECRDIVDRTLPAIGQTHIDLLCQILAKQVKFSTTSLTRIVLNLEPAIERGWPKTSRLWRTGTVRREALNSGTYIVWLNDAQVEGSETARIVELKPNDSSRDWTTDRSRSVGKLIPLRLKRRRWKRAIKTERSRIDGSRRAPSIEARRLSESILATSETEIADPD